MSRALKIVQRKFYIPPLNSGVRQKCVFSCEQAAGRVTKGNLFHW